MYPKTQSKIQTLLEEKIFPGVNYAFIKGTDTQLKTLGHAQIVPTKEKLSADHLYDVASLTKVIGTTSLILKLWEEGDIDLMTPLHHYLPAFTNPDITILELLTHTSDVQAYIENRDQLSPDQLRQALLQLAPGDNRGQRMQYTDTGTLLFGFLLESLKNQPIQKQITEEVLKPLGMTHSTFNPTSSDIVAPTEQHPKRGLIKGQVHDPKAYTLGEHCGSAGLFSSVEDCLIFARMILNQGKNQRNQTFLKSSTIQQLSQDWTGKNHFMRSLSWDLLPGKTGEPPLLYHTGYTGTFMIIDCHNQEAFVFLSNRVHPVDNRDEYLAKRDELIKIYLEEK